MPRDSNIWMWSHALEMMEQAERLHRRFCLPRPPFAARPVWEPPVDIVETPSQFRITVVLPGVRPETVELTTLDEVLVVAGYRAIPGGGDVTAIHCLEIPYGRFERHIPLPVGHFVVDEPVFEDGCLTIIFNKSKGPLDLAARPPHPHY